jgi:predicted metal-dependent RNase
MTDLMTITPLGSGQEVGRSCHVLEFRGMKVMLDIGYVHAAASVGVTFLTPLITGFIPDTMV